MPPPVELSDIDRERYARDRVRHAEMTEHRRDLAEARTRQERRGDGMSRAADRDHWDKRALAIRAAVPIVEVIERVVALKKNAGLCPFHGEATPSFRVYPRGGDRVKVGFFICYGCDAKGDVIQFVMRHQKLDWIAAIRFLENENGIRLLTPAAAPPPRPDVPQADELRKLARAQRIFDEAVALGAGGVVDQYLRGRGIVPPSDYGVGDAAVNGGWPVDLRFHERCYHDLDRREFPAMVAPIRGYDGTLLTVHRTYLARAPGGGWTKAPVDKAKLVVGSWAPGTIRLGPDAGEMIGGEGIETSLSAMQLAKRSGLAFVNSGRMKTVELPFLCSDFIYAADKGGKNGTNWGERFAHDGARANEHARKVTVRLPNLPDAKCDFNDVVRERARRAACSAAGSDSDRSAGAAPTPLQRVSP